jgi:hypothetical protein
LQSSARFGWVCHSSLSPRALVITLVITGSVIYLCDITNVSLSERAFQEIRRMIVTLDDRNGAAQADLVRFQKH